MLGLIHHLGSYVKGWHLCQLSRNKKLKKLPVRPLQQRTYSNHKPLSGLSMDLKVMPKLYQVISSFCV